MLWSDQWRALSARIDGLVRGMELFALTHQASGGHDRVSVLGKSLLPELEALNAELATFRDAHGAQLPELARAALTDYLDGGWSRGVNAGQVQAIVPIGVFRSRFEYCIANTEAAARSQVELAFEHLRRSIVVNADVRGAWLEAHTQHETRCEQLGAVHLLSHGIWAFKAVGAGAATDLVMAEPVSGQIARVTRTASALVLTEWKRIADDDTVREAAAAAREQARQYAAGALGALELKRTRYIVLVVKTDVDPPDDVEDAEVLYRHVVVPVAPLSPSKGARQRTRARRKQA